MRQRTLNVGHSVHVTTSIPGDIYTSVKDAHIGFNTLILLGWQAWKGQPAILARQHELEQENEKLKRAVSKLQSLVLDVQSEVKSDARK